MDTRELLALLFLSSKSRIIFLGSLDTLELSLNSAYLLQVGVGGGGGGEITGGKEAGSICQRASEVERKIKTKQEEAQCVVGNGQARLIASLLRRPLFYVFELVPLFAFGLEKRSRQQFFLSHSHWIYCSS